MTIETHARRSLWMLAVALLGMLPAMARAENLLPRDEGFMKEPKSVAYRRYKLSGKSDFGAFGSFSMKNKLTEHFGGAITFDQQFNEYFALDVFGDGGFGGLTNLASNIRATARLSGSNGDDLADAGALVATGQLGIRFTPVYGKMSLSSELPVHFNFYLAGGAGVALVQFNSILTCNVTPSGSRCPGDNFRQETDPKLAFNVGGGFRFWATDLLSLRVEVRDVMFPDQFFTNVNFKQPQGTGTVTSSGISHVPLVLVGLGFLL